MRIGTLARRVGLATGTIRYYEQSELIDPPRRDPSGYRNYDESAVRRLTFIVRARRLGLSLDAIRDVVAAGESGTVCCEDVEVALRHQKAQLEGLILEAGRLRDAIDQALSTTERGTVAADQCQLIELGFGVYERTGTGS